MIDYRRITGQSPRDHAMLGTVLSMMRPTDGTAETDLHNSTVLAVHTALIAWHDTQAVGPPAEADEP